jgi:hypothetical protein
LFETVKFAAAALAGTTSTPTSTAVPHLTQLLTLPTVTVGPAERKPTALPWPAVSAQAFSQRLATRQRRWWGWRRPALRDAAHRWRAERALRARDDPDDLWHCCSYWPRTLVNKWNGREFAARHGCDLPELYWAGSGYSEAVLQSLPQEFAVRPFLAPATELGAVVADGRELLRGEPFSPATVYARLPKSRVLGRRHPVLIEELIKPEDGSVALPLECKVHAFGRHAVAVQVNARRYAGDVMVRFYATNWEPIPDRMTLTPFDGQIRERPQCLERMLELASAIGASIGTYMRIDFFVTARGCVFNEFSSVPGGGANWCTAYCDELFGRYWMEFCPDTV